MHAVLITRVAYSPATYATYLIDVTGTTLTVGSVLSMATALVPQYGASVPFHIYDPVTGRIMLLATDGSGTDSTMLQVFSASTGALLSEAKAPGGGVTPTGLYMNPADHTKFAGFDANEQQLNFTVALDGSTCTFGGHSDMALLRGGIYPGAAGSPYITGGPGLIAEATSGVYPVNYYAADGTMPASAAGVGGEYVNLFGPAVTLGDAKHLISYAEMDNNIGGYGVLGGFEGRLFAVDQSVVPATMVQLSLSYPTAGYSYVFDIAHMDADQTTGIILIGAMVKNGTVVSSVLWTVQGPAMTPNLTGQLLADRVRFT
jgi:hypothetical protein